MDTQLHIFCRTEEQWKDFVNGDGADLRIDHVLSGLCVNLRIAETQITVFSPIGKGTQQ